MKKQIFTGAATALVTPFKEDGSVNFECLRVLVEHQISEGIDALVLCGTTGEKSTLNYAEHIEVIKVAASQAAGRVPIIAGAGSNDTVYSVGICNEAVAAGADALLLVTPYYNKTSQTGLVKHYEYIADRVNAPIILYNVPSRTGVNINPETYKELSRHFNIVAAKEANGDISAISKTISLCGEDLQIYSGNDDQTVPMLSLGGIGVISVLSNILPRVTHSICEQYLSGRVQAAKEMQLKYTPLINALFSDVNPMPIKCAMNMLGLEVGGCRLPLIDLSEDKKQALRNELKKVNLLK